MTTASVKCIISCQCSGVYCCDDDGMLLMPVLAWSSSLVTVNEQVSIRQVKQVYHRSVEIQYASVMPP